MITPKEAIAPYRAAGIVVLPAPYRKKNPSIEWKEYQTRPPTDEEYENWFGNCKLSSYWVLCGAVSAIAGLDADGARGVAWATENVGEEVLGRTTCVKTSRGFHWWWSLAPGEMVRSWKRDDVGVELHGEGSGLIAPPSIHASGIVYKFVRGLEALQPLPAVLREAQREERQRGEGLAGLLAAPAGIGGRNDWLTAVAGHYAKQIGFRDGYTESVRLANAALSEPLDDGEWRKTADSVWKAEQRKKGTEPDLHTDRGNARRFAQRVKGKVAWVVGWGWRVYNEATGCFVEDESALSQAVDQAVKEIYREAEEARDSKVKSEIKRWAKASSSARGVENLLKLARAEPSLVAYPDEFDQELGLLNCRNGVLDLEKRELRAHSPELKMTMCADVVYDPTAVCELWDRHLKTILQDDVELWLFIQRWAGRALSGLTPSDNCRILMPYGTGANGKTITVETLAMVLGGYAASTDFATWCAGVSTGGSARADLARLAGIRLVTATESGYHHRLDEALLKQYTGGEQVSPRMLYQSAPVVFRPQFSLLLSTNHLPRLEGADVGFWRRFLKVGFEYYIPDPDQDVQMLSRLRKETSGILNWALDGYRAWREQGLDPPMSVLMETAQYRTDIDWVGQFISENLVESKGNRLEMRKLYTAYEHWCLVGGIRNPMGSNNLSSRLVEHGLKRELDPQTRRSVIVGMNLVEQQFTILGVEL